MDGWQFLGWALALLLLSWFGLLVWTVTLVRKFDRQEQTHQCLNRQY